MEKLIAVEQEPKKKKENEEGKLRASGSKRCSLIHHLLVLRFLHRLVDVIEDLPAALRRLLHFVLLHGTV